MYIHPGPCPKRKSPIKRIPGSLRTTGYYVRYTETNGGNNRKLDSAHFCLRVYHTLLVIPVAPRRKLLIYGQHAYRKRTKFLKATAAFLIPVAPRRTGSGAESPYFTREIPWYHEGNCLIRRVGAAGVA